MAGTAVTALCLPGDNLGVHVAVEQCRPGDVLVVATTSPSRDGYIGELLATSMRAMGVVGLVTETGVRDIAELRRIAFPVWAAAVSAKGTTKKGLAGVNVPVVIGSTVVSPGDVVVGDDDGAICVAREAVPEVARAGAERVILEAKTRERLLAGELGLDIYELRPLLRELSLQVVDGVSS
jgi:4-hydroxy-4-methyl-2-oxoglutarate aldolase